MNFGDLQQICGKMQLHGKTPCVHDYISGFDESSFLQDLDLIVDDVIDAGLL